MESARRVAPSSPPPLLDRRAGDRSHQLHQKPSRREPQIGKREGRVGQHAWSDVCNHHIFSFHCNSNPLFTWSQPTVNIAHDMQIITLSYILHFPVLRFWRSLSNFLMMEGGYPIYAYCT
ncbi:hypothetical protein J6590_057616 [Homalodisca vitripennis]|nr:hypothetical protein J6590_057616 [Homalodisca vitripennis]